MKTTSIETMCIAFFFWEHPALPDLHLLALFNRDEVLHRSARMHLVPFVSRRPGTETDTRCLRAAGASGAVLPPITSPHSSWAPPFAPLQADCCQPLLGGSTWHPGWARPGGRRHVAVHLKARAGCLPHQLPRGVRAVGEAVVGRW